MRKSNWKKYVAVAMSVMCMAGAIVGCGKNSAGNDGTEGGNSANTKITVVSREDGSGTRGAFEELFDVETTEDAIISNSTEVLMTTVAGNGAAIGYTSLGALKDTVKAVKIDGAVASVDNVKNGSYKVSRPFNIATKSEVSDIAQDFINFILSAEGQKVIEDKGYISEGNSGAFKSNGAKGTVVVAGSSSVTPVMEKLADEYKKVNSGAEVQINQSDSSSGMTAAAEGTCDIGMASRELKDSEIAKGIKGTKIAIDGIAVIVNNSSSVDNLTSEQVKSIFEGDTTVWGDVK